MSVTGRLVHRTFIWPGQPGDGGAVIRGQASGAEAMRAIAVGAGVQDPSRLPVASGN